MKRHIIKEYIRNFNLPLVRIIFVLGIFSTLISCEVEDDMPPPSAWVEPEPIEGCTQIVGVPEISEGIDFECEYPETEAFGNTNGTLTVEPADNPDKEGINTSDKVMMVTQTAGVEGWAGFFFNLASKVDFSEKQTIKIKVYSPAEGQNILLKLEDSSDGSIAKEVQKTTTVANEWEELSFAFSPSDNDKFDRMVLFFNFNGDKDATTVHYFDDIVLAEGGATEEPGGGSEPTSAPATPTADAADVLSIFSDAYTDPAGINYSPDWGQSTSFEMLDFDGNEVIKYSNANYQGIEFGESLDLSTYATLNIDVWSGDYTSIPIFLISSGPVEKSVSLNVTPNQWNTIEIPLADFTGEGLDISDVIQIKFAVESAGGDFYIDNLYFSNESTGGTSGNPSSAPSAPTVDAANVISIYSDSYTNPSSVNYFPSWNQSTAFEVIDFSGNEVIEYSNLNYQGIEFGESFDLSGFTTLSIDVWSGDYTSIPIYLISEGSGEKSVSLEVTSNQWNTIKIPLEEFSSQGLDITDIFQIKFAVESAGGTFYIDNLYFSNETGGGGSAETLSLPLDFDGSMNYASKTSGVTFEVVSNPQQSGANSTDTKVGAVTNNGDAYEALTIGLDEAIDFSGSNKTITMKVYSETAYPVLFKLETGVNGERANEVEVNHGGTGWEELTFDFNNARKSYIDGNQGVGEAFVPTGMYDTFSIFLDFAGTTAGTFYIDDIKQN